MVQKKGKRTLFTALAVLLVLLVAIGTIAIIKATSKDKTDPYRTQDTTTTETTDTPKKDDVKQETKPSKPEKDDEEKSEVTLDPATVAAVDIVPMSLTVSYVKGVGSFEYEVLRTTNGTRYVVFSSPELAGTKCTNDKGMFASILANPEGNDSTTLTKTTTVDGTKYGLSLESATCTPNPDKLQSYQKAFSDAFSLLKKMN